MPRKVEKSGSSGSGACCECGGCGCDCHGLRGWRGGRGRGVGKLLFALFILLIGVSWLGNDAGIWKFNLPWLPLAVTLLGIALVAKWLARSSMD